MRRGLRATAAPFRYNIGAAAKEALFRKRKIRLRVIERGRTEIDVVSGALSEVRGTITTTMPFSPPVRAGPKQTMLRLPRTTVRFKIEVALFGQSWYF